MGGGGGGAARPAPAPQRHAWPIALFCTASLLAGTATASGPPETIVLLRHGEKPPAGLGQLDCQGLNRALALPSFIARAFGRPAAIFAPDPADKKEDGGTAYAYIRPLATIEPTAIAFGLTVDVSHGVRDWQSLAQAIDGPAYAGQVVLVAWEHSDLVKLARSLMRAHGADAASVPEWDRRDFDSLYVLRIASGGGVTFEHRREGLDGLPVTCAK